MTPVPVPPIVPLDDSTIVQAMLLSFALGMAVALLHRLAIMDRIVGPSITVALVLLSMGGCLVMLTIGESLPRAFTLVGALAVIRFRTNLGNPIDIAFVFLAMVMGISAGVLAWHVGLIGIGTIGLALLVMGLLPSGGESNIVRIDLVAHEQGDEDIDKLLDKHVTKRWLEQARSVRFGETISLWYRVTLRRGASMERLVTDLSAFERVERVVVLASDELVEAGTSGSTK
jgi:hypothetical protein